MSPYIAQLTLPRLGESKRCASFYDLQARSFRAEKLTLNSMLSQSSLSTLACAKSLRWSVFGSAVQAW